MERSENTLLYVTMIIAMATWGLSWTNGKILSAYTSPSVLMVLRFIIAAVSMAFVLIASKSPWKISQHGILHILAGSILLVFYNYFYFTGTKIGPAGAGGVLVTTLNPVLTFILISILHRRLPKGRAFLGILLGILGGSILISIWQNGWDAIFIRGNQYFVMCALSWAFLTLISAGIEKHMSTLTFSFWLYLVSGLLSLLLVNDSNIYEVFTFGWEFWLNLLAISVGAMAFATTAYFIAASRLGSGKASAFIFTVPVSAMLFSMIILKESLEFNIVIGGTMSIMAVYLINTKKADA